MIGLYLKRVLSFFAILISVLIVLFLIFEYQSVKNNLIGFKDVYTALEKATQPKRKVKTIVIGDSLAEQAYGLKADRDSIYSMACNQAPSLAGQYLILKTFLENYKHGNNLQVYLVYHPNSFNNDLDGVNIYNYFLKPFYKKENLEEFPPKILEKIQKIPFFYLSRLDIVKNSNWAPSGGTKPIVKGPKCTKPIPRISETSAIYLRKIAVLCKNHPSIFEFKMYCPFLSEKYKALNYTELKNDVAHFQLENYFTDYFERTLYLHSSFFLEDCKHLKDRNTLPFNYLKL